MSDFYRSWDGCLGGRSGKESGRVIWSPPSPCCFKFNFDGVAKGKPGPTWVGVLCNMEGLTSLFSVLVDIRDSNEAELIGIWRALVLWANFGQGKFKWAGGSKRPPWKLLSVAKEIRALCSSMDVSLQHGRQLANRVADFLSEVGVHRAWLCCILLKSIQIVFERFVKVFLGVLCNFMGTFVGFLALFLCILGSWV